MATQASMTKIINNAAKNILDGVSGMVYHTMPFLPINYLVFLVHLFRAGLAWCTIGIYHSAISAFLEPHPNHLIISKLMHHFYLPCPPSCKQFDPWDIKNSLFLSERWALASSLTTLNLP